MNNTNWVKEKADIQLHCPRCKSDNIVMTRINEDVTQYDCGNCGASITTGYAFYEYRDAFEYKFIDSNISEKNINGIGLEGWDFSFKNSEDKLVFKRHKKIKIRITPEWKIKE